MTNIEIIEERCTGCGACAAICPDSAIKLCHKKAVVLHDDCFLCGHCRAVCPEEAIRIPALLTDLVLTSAAFRRDAAGSTVSSGALAALMQRRRSCRRFSNHPVSLDLLHDLVQLGVTAPSGTNSQQWGFILLPGRDDVLALGERVGDYYRRLNTLADLPILSAALKFLGMPSLAYYRERYRDSVAEALLQWDAGGIDRLFHGATAAILVTGRRTASCAMEDSLLATQNILLAAESAGLGSCLIGFVVEAARRDQSIRNLLQLPKDEDLHSVIALGHPAVAWHRFSGRRAVKPRVMQLGKDRPESACRKPEKW